MTLQLNNTSLIEKIPVLKAGVEVEFSGVVYTARDMACKRLVEMIQRGEPLPFDLKDSVIYYCGPTPAKFGEAIGSCGPTTSSRMDIFTPTLLANGVKATIGKGPRSEAVKQSLIKYKALYLVATGGVGALLSRKVKSSSVVAFNELGTEAIYKLEVVDFPLAVAGDAYGNDIFSYVIP
jgi:fumarate hydratase subunit beta